jgi:hypothetical protein
MNKLILFLCAAALSFAAACSNQDDENIQPTPQSSDILPQYSDRMEVIATMSNDYEKSVLEALSERNRLKSSGNAAAFDIDQRIKTLFAEKCNKYPSIELQPQTKSGASEEFFIDPQKLQEKLDNLVELFDCAIEAADENIEKEELLANLQKVSDDFCTTVLSDVTLLDAEKQQIRENVVFRTNLALTSIKYGEEVAELLWLETKGCNWWCKAKKIVKCTAKSAYAAGVCIGAGITTYTSGINPASIGAWGLCYTAAYDAWLCWR